jgi:hypothetical protein
MIASAWKQSALPSNQYQDKSFLPIIWRRRYLTEFVKEYAKRLSAFLMPKGKLKECKKNSHAGAPLPW